MGGGSSKPEGKVSSKPSAVGGGTDGTRSHNRKGSNADSSDGDSTPRKKDSGGVQERKKRAQAERKGNAQVGLPAAPAFAHVPPRATVSGGKPINPLSEASITYVLWSCYCALYIHMYSFCCHVAVWFFVVHNVDHSLSHPSMWHVFFQKKKKKWRKILRLEIFFGFTFSGLSTFFSFFFFIFLFYRIVITDKSRRCMVTHVFDANIAVVCIFLCVN